MSHVPAFVIRLYEPRDREAVRRIGCDTADRGEPVERFFADRELVADLLTDYYTDYEPQAAWVAEYEGEVVGYLTGCLDTRAYWRFMTWRVVPRALWKAVGRGRLWSPKTWRLLSAGIKTFQQGGFRREIPVDRFPAHLHVNVQAGLRGQGMGRRLVEQFIAQARAAGVPGIHASVRGDNVPACNLFEALGFVALSRHPVMMPHGEAYQQHDAILYGKPL